MFVIAFFAFDCLLWGALLTMGGSKMCSFEHLGQNFEDFFVAGSPKRCKMEQDVVIRGGSWHPKLTATLIYPWAQTPIGVQNCTKYVKRACRSVLEHDSRKATETGMFSDLLQPAQLISHLHGSSILTQPPVSLKARKKQFWVPFCKPF